uniref:DUF4587 domain-containing protein n=1 Tax=Crocodylus porosus TaxID=8502 RepID=A0A7M4DX74_CROPO
SSPQPGRAWCCPSPSPQRLPALAPHADPGAPVNIFMLTDLIELMMIQNAQMHQVIMNNLTMSALTSFGLSPAPPTAQGLKMTATLPTIIQGGEEHYVAAAFAPAATLSSMLPLPTPKCRRGRREISMCCMSTTMPAPQELLGCYIPAGQPGSSAYAADSCF